VHGVAVCRWARFHTSRDLMPQAGDIGDRHVIESITADYAHLERSTIRAIPTCAMGDAVISTSPAPHPCG
jgi:hypothetical protein